MCTAVVHVALFIDVHTCVDICAVDGAAASCKTEVRTHTSALMSVDVTVYILRSMLDYAVSVYLSACM
jgi:hypothetical protein